METKHTPGPWSCNLGNGTNLTHDVTIWGDSERVVVGNVGDEISGEYDDTNIANARLIAAAPELLAALQGTLAMLKLLNAPGTNDPIEARVFQARAAIAKATGTKQP